jgi:O-antigen/teichoic acid export membrane protein
MGRVGASAAVFVGFELARALALVVGVVWLGGLSAALWGAAAVMGLRVACVVVLAGAGVLPVRRPSRLLLGQQLAYALPYALSAALYVAQRQLGQYVVSARYDAATFAVFAVASFHLTAVEVIYTPSCEVLIVELSGALARGDLAGARSAWHDAVLKLAALFFPMAALFWATGPQLLAALFTHKYAASAPVFMAATLEVPLAVVAVDAVMRAAAATRFLLVVNALRLVGGLALVILGLALFGLPGAPLGVVTAELVGRLAMLARSRAHLDMPLRVALPWRGLFRSAVCAALPALPAALAARHLFASPRWAAGGAALVYLLGYALAWRHARVPRRTQAGRLEATLPSC